MYNKVGNKSNTKDVNPLQSLEQIIHHLTSLQYEEDWFEFKENWFEPVKLGQYISALSNTAAMLRKKFAYFVWGINDSTHKVVGTTFNHHQDVKNEPLEHYLARQLFPHITINFQELSIANKRIVILTIPAATQIPTAFNEVRYFRIGSSMVNLAKYPEHEVQLFNTLRDSSPSLETVEAYTQDLTFNKLLLYYADSGITLKPETFKKNLGLLTKNGSYNLLAQLLSDNNQLPLRVSQFNGISKSAPLYSVREFGNDCILRSLDKLLSFSEVLNTPQADEKNRIVERKEVPLFNQDAFREAIINAFVHNRWVDGNSPMINVYTDRIEILSRGTLAPQQTQQGFFLGESIPVNRKLSDIFLQLHISERSGRGIPKITAIYGKEVFEFRENSIVVTLPFNTLLTPPTVNAPVQLNATRKKIVDSIKANPHITQKELSQIIGISATAISNNIKFLKDNHIIQREGSNKNGYWRIL